MVEDKSWRPTCLDVAKQILVDYYFDDENKPALAIEIYKSRSWDNPEAIVCNYNHAGGDMHIPLTRELWTALLLACPRNEGIISGSDLKECQETAEFVLEYIKKKE